MVDFIRYHAEAVDAFGRQKVSNPETVFDSKFLFDKFDDVAWSETLVDGSGNATSTHVDADSVVAVHLEAGDSCTRQTRQRFLYQPGKSHAWIGTAVLATGTGVTCQYGLLDADDGLAFQISGSTVSVIKRKGASDTVVNQSSWNLDKLDGTGPSGLNVDFTKLVVFTLDMEWLSGGQARFGVFVEGRPVWCHAFTHSPLVNGDDAITAPYTRTPNLPVRFYATVAGGGTTIDVKHICSTVINEGGSPKLGKVSRVSTNGTHINGNADGTRYPLLGVRLSTSRLDAVIDVEDVNALNEQSGDFEWVLGMNPSAITNSSKITWSTGPHGYQIAAGSSSISMSSTMSFEWEITGGFVKSSNQGGGTANIHGEVVLRPGIKLDGTRDEFWLVARPLAANADFQGTIQVRSHV